MASTEKISDGLRSLLLEQSVKQTSSPSQSLIQVLHSDENGARDHGGSASTFYSKSLDDEDDDGEPPPIFQDTSSGNIKPVNDYGCRWQSLAAETPTLAEQLLAEAKLAKEKQQREQKQQERLSANKSTFGMKKGFLNSSSSKKKDSSKKNFGIEQRISKVSSEKCVGDDAVAAREGDGSNAIHDNLIHELDNDGNMLPSSYKQNNTHNPLHLPEVQSAVLPPSAQWATPDILDTITHSHPNLARGLKDPQYTAALQDMQHKPKETVELLQKTNPEIVDWLMEFCDVLGKHFLQIGEELDGKMECGYTNEGEETKGGAAKVREIGLLEKRALERHQKMRTAKDDVPGTQAGAQDANAHPSKDMMDDQVSIILANEELRSILMDPVMQNIMEECSTGNKLPRYMTHEVYGPKLRLLMEAGLIQMA